MSRIPTRKQYRTLLERARRVVCHEEGCASGLAGFTPRSRELPGCDCIVAEIDRALGARGGDQ